MYSTERNRVCFEWKQARAQQAAVKFCRVVVVVFNVGNVYVLNGVQLRFLTVFFHNPENINRNFHVEKQ